MIEYVAVDASEHWVEVNFVRPGESVCAAPGIIVGVDIDVPFSTASFRGSFGLDEL